MANPQSPPASIMVENNAAKPSFLRHATTKASEYHSRVPYLQKLPFPAIAIIVTLIIVNLLVWAAVGVALVSHITK